MSDSPHGDLLPSQVRALQAAIGQSALADQTFEWHKIDGSWAGYMGGYELPAIVHRESGSLFSIEYHDAWSDGYGSSGPAEFRYFRRPGIQSQSDTKGVRTWDQVLAEFNLWLRLVARELGRSDVVAPTSAGRTPTAFAEIWPLLHPEIRDIARPRFESGHRADAVEAALKHVNELLRQRTRDAVGKDLDGAKLMKHVFSVEKPVLRFGDLSTETGRSMQVGYMELFAGAMTGVRNPKAHSNVEIDSIRAVHFLFLASLLRYKLDEARPA